MNLACKVCARRYSGSQRSGGHCTVCCTSFSSQGMFDSHRVGDFNDGTRRCLTPEEMLKKGWRLVDPVNRLWKLPPPENPWWRSSGKDTDDVS